MVFLFILIILITIIIFSTIRLEINNFKFCAPKVENKFVNDNFKIQIKILFINIIPILKLNITKEKIKKMKSKNRFKKFNFKIDNFGKNVNKDTLKDVKQLKLKIKKFCLKLYLGTDNTIVTSMIVPTISTILAIYLSKKKVENSKFEINPIYNSGNIANIDFEGIFEVKMIHIIKVIYIINKKRRVEENERTSNRGTYGYSYE